MLLEISTKIQKLRDFSCTLLWTESRIVKFIVIVELWFSGSGEREAESCLMMNVRLWNRGR